MVLYAMQHEPAEPTWLGDYPKMAMWDDRRKPSQNAYFLTVNLFDGPSLAFRGRARFCARSRDHAQLAVLRTRSGLLSALPCGRSYSFVAAKFRAGDPPPAGRDELVLAIDSPATGGVTLTQVHGRLFHVDFVTPGNSTFGVGADHHLTRRSQSTGSWMPLRIPRTRLVPQQGTATRLDTLGDKIMTPVVYQNSGGTESLWADHYCLY